MTDDDLPPISLAPIALNHSYNDRDDFYAEGGSVSDLGPPSVFHQSVMGRIETRPPGELQAIYFEVTERGPLSLIEPMEAEFERRGLDRYASYTGK